MARIDLSVRAAVVPKKQTVIPKVAETEPWLVLVGISVFPVKGMKKKTTA